MMDLANHMFELLTALLGLATASLPAFLFFKNT